MIVDEKKAWRLVIEGLASLLLCLVCHIYVALTYDLKAVLLMYVATASITWYGDAYRAQKALGQRSAK